MTCNIMVLSFLSTVARAALLVSSTVHAKQEAVLSSSDEVLFAGEYGPLHMLQYQAIIDKGSEKSLPKVSSVLTKPNAILDTMTSRIGALEDNLGAFHRKTTKHIAHIRARYEQNLTSQHKQNRAIKNANAELSGDIARLEAANTRLRKQADDYLKLNNDLAARLKSLQGNMSLAQEFVSIALNRSSELLDNAPELQVMQELAKEEQERKKRAAVKRAFGAFSTGVHMSAMQIGEATHGRGKDDDAENVLDLMSGALSELQKQQRASELELLKEFEKEFQTIADERAHLLSEQAELNSTKAHALKLQANLTEAVSHLHEANKNMHKQLDALLSFSARLGRDPPTQNKDLSLLQTAPAKKKDTLPGLSKVLRKPSAAMDSVNRQVNQLRDRLERMHQQSNDMSTEQRDDYDKQLLELNGSISHQQQVNAKVQEEIDMLDQRIAASRSQAEQMALNNKKMRDDLTLIQSNMSLAQEYLAQLLNDTHEPLGHTKDLRVLKELAEQDAAQSAQQAHEEQLKEVSMIALLQLPGGQHMHNDHPAPAQDLLSSLEAAVDSLEEEHKASQAQLRESFDKEYSALNETYHTLVQQWGKLNATKAEKSDLQHRLEIAVEHLDRTGQQLSSRRVSLLNFAGKLAALPSPIEQGVSLAVGNTSTQESGMMNFKRAYDVLTGLLSSRDVSTPNGFALTGLAGVRERLR